MLTIEEIKVVKLLTDVFKMELLPKKTVMISKHEEHLRQLTGEKLTLNRNTKVEIRFLAKKESNKPKDYFKETELIDFIQKECNKLGFSFSKSEIRDHGLLNNRIKHKIKTKKTNYPNTEWGSKDAPFWKQYYGI